jgi:D-glycero-alpha-D-manno-heptose-7-phosphate kinase
MNSKSIPQAVSTLTPLRISLVGGGTDLPAYYENHDGAVISSAIDKYIYVTVKRHSPLFRESYRLSYSTTELVESHDDIKNDIMRECLKFVPVDPPIYISTAADLPTSSGLGSSSSFAVGLLHALHLLRGERVSPAQLAEEASEIEINILKNPIGKQDQFAAAFGGLNHFYFKKNGRVDIDHLVLQDNLINQVFENSLLIWTGVQRSASKILQKQNINMRSHIQEYDFIAKATNELKDIFLKSPSNFLQLVGELLDKTWDVKKKLEGSISSEHIDAMHSRMGGLGSLGGKLSGAGGGGFLFEIVQLKHHQTVVDAFRTENVVKIAYEPHGSRVLSVVY